jgi:hypothetical protein
LLFEEEPIEIIDTRAQSARPAVSAGVAVPGPSLGFHSRPRRLGSPSGRRAGAVARAVGGARGASSERLAKACRMLNSMTRRLSSPGMVPASSGPTGTQIAVRGALICTTAASSLPRHSQQFCDHVSASPDCLGLHRDRNMQCA